MARSWRRPVVGALIVVGVGVGIWATLRFGVLAWLPDGNHPARPLVEGLSWLAGIGAFPLAVITLIVQVRSTDRTDAGRSRVDTSQPAAQSAGEGGVNLSGGVHGHGAGPTFGVVSGGHVTVNHAPPDPPEPTRS